MSSGFPPPSKPRPVDGGIAVRSKRGSIAQTWWSERFISVLESLGVGGRLTRGKTYARKGQVIDLRVDAGSVAATVQGSRARPYRVRIGVSAYGKAEWTRLCQALTDNAWYTAKLLAGEMPTDIDEIFTAQGLSLFPADPDDLSMDCSCPDWEVPCKHLAAVFYLLAEKFDADPFIILAWRGREREDLLDTLASLRSGTVAADREEHGDDAVPLAECLDHFFTAGPATRPAITPAASDSLLDQLPDTGIKVRNASVIESLRPVYRSLDTDDVDI